MQFQIKLIYQRPFGGIKPADISSGTIFAVDCVDILMNYRYAGSDTTEGAKIIHPQEVFRKSRGVFLTVAMKSPN